MKVLASMRRGGSAVSRSSRISPPLAFLGCLLITRLQDDEADHDDDGDEEEEVVV